MQNAKCKIAVKIASDFELLYCFMGLMMYACFEKGRTDDFRRQAGACRQIINL